MDKKIGKKKKKKEKKNKRSGRRKLTTMAAISLMRLSPRNQMRTGGGRDPRTRQVTVTSLPADSGSSAPNSCTSNGGTVPIATPLV